MDDRLNLDLIEIILKRNELNRLTYNSREYDLVEEELHDLEDAFNENHGFLLENALISAHEKCCPETEVMVPVAYVAKNYTVINEAESRTAIFEPAPGGGLPVDSPGNPHEVLRLVLVPNPPRILLKSGEEVREEIWRQL
jgi:hypothetical protein